MRTTEMSMEKMIKGLQMVRSNYGDETMVAYEYGEINVAKLIHEVIMVLNDKTELKASRVNCGCANCIHNVFGECTREYVNIHNEDLYAVCEDYYERDDEE